MFHCFAGKLAGVDKKLSCSIDQEVSVKLRLVDNDRKLRPL
jgi:hypothetical protein